MPLPHLLGTVGFRAAGLRASSVQDPVVGERGITRTDVAPLACAVSTPPIQVREPVASISELAVSFQRGSGVIHALRGVSVEVGESEVVAVVGESGSGKSVLGLSMLGLLGRDAKVSGSVEVCGVDMVGADGEARRLVRRDHLGAVFQDPMTSLNPTMRIGRQLVEATGSVDEAVRLLDLTGIPDPRRRLRAYPHELSGGLRQRVMIAMAVAGGPRLVVADEPTTALDVTVQAQILSLLRTLRTELRTSFLFITHDLGVAGSFADRVIVLYGGRLVEGGPIRQAVEAPAHHYTAGLLGTRLALHDGDGKGRRRPPLSGLAVDPRSVGTGCLFAPRCPAAGPECVETVPEVVISPGDRVVACHRPLDPSSRAASVLPSAPLSVDSPTPTRVPETAAPALRLAGVTCSFRVHGGRLAALRGVDLSVAAGESVAIVGESGCGKSTVLRVVAGLTAASGGSVELGHGPPPQMVFQDAGASLTPWLTVGEMLTERLRAAGVPGRDRDGEVGDALGRVGLSPEVASARGRQLSGGQRQRVALARATIVPPSLLLCDEPTSALDASLAATVLDLLGRLRRELGMAMLFVTHDLAVARAVADRIIVMYLGRIVETGVAAELIEAPMHPYSGALVDAVPDIGSVPTPLSGEPANPLAVPDGCEFAPRCLHANERCTERPELVVLGAPGGVPPGSVACWTPLGRRGAGVGAR